MSEPVIKCPKCNAEIRLTESLAAPLIEATRREYQERLDKKERECSERESGLREREKAISEAVSSVEATVAEQVQKERSRIVAEEARKARQALAIEIGQKTNEIAELQDILNQRDEKLAEAQRTELDVLRKQRELEDAKRELDLTVEKKVREGLALVRREAVSQAEETFKLKVQEREETIASMQRQIEDLKRKAEQGSQQLQGEVLELDLEAQLKACFPLDTIEPVPKGTHGGDVLQRVRGSMGQLCGKIIWEAKRTRNWNDGWLPKLREDQRSAKDEVAIIVSEALPKDLDVFGLMDGVCVAHPRAAMAVAGVMRQSLIELAMAKQASQGQQSKMAMVYEYITSPRFRQRVQAVVESFSAMQEDLAREKKVMIKQWAKREEQIQRITNAALGMYGDLQGITGKALEEIVPLELDSPQEVSVGIAVEISTRSA
ncbi:MAG TPA: DUF2130 domain-containing protein [Terriglobia bacterium]|nr:DUF2130 domain-containing protein [Terriglobia bacterium]